MKKKRTRFRLVALLVIFALTLGVTAFAAFAAGDGDSLPTEATINATYNIGDTVTLPDIALGGGKASPVVYCPDGSAATGKYFTVSNAGAHSVVYRLGQNEKRYDFTAVLPLARTSRGSNITFGTRQKTYPARFLDLENNNEWGKYGPATDTSTYVASAEGLHVELKQSDTFTYGKVINLHTLGDKPFLTFGLLPDDGVLDAGRIYFNLTDAHDPSISMSVQLATAETSNAASLESPAWWSFYTYVQGKTGYQPYTGWEGEWLHSGQNPYGAHIYMGMFGNRSGRRVDSERASLYYDPVEKQLLCGSLGGTNLVCDFDSRENFDSLFGGFTTGEVFLTVTATKYSSDAVNLYFTEIGGETLGEETPRTVDIPAPTLVVDAPETPTDAVVGYPYSLFAASATSPYYADNVPVNSEVYYAYGKSAETRVTVTDGKFTPSKAGVYTVIYTSRSTTGNAATKTVDITARPANFSPVTVGAVAAFTAQVGEKTAIPVPEIAGGVGAVTLKITATLGYRKYTIENGTFTPQAAGAHTVTYTARDAAGREATTTAVMTVSYADAPVLDADEIVLPRYFLKGYTYTLPVVYGKHYSTSGVTLVKAGVFASVGSIEGNKFTPTEEGNTNIVYTAVRGGHSSAKVFTVPVVDVKPSGTLDLTKYFDAKGFNVSATDEYIALTQTAADNTFAFVNALVADGFGATFSLPTTVPTGSALVVTLTDEVSNESIDLTFERTARGVEAKLFHETVYTFVGNSDITVSYTAYTNSFKFGTGDAVVADGFGGFASGKLYFTARFTGSASGEVRMRNLNVQRLHNTTVDIVNPIVQANGVFRPEQGYGTTLNVHAAAAADVLDPIATTTVTVVAPDGTFAVGGDGTTLNNAPADKAYAVTLTQYGNYAIRYRVTVSNGQSAARVYSVNVFDDVAPTLTLQNVQTSFKTGDTLPAFGYTVSDNVDSAEDITVKVYVRNIDTYVWSATNNGRYTFRSAGNYVVRYTAVDSSGNASHTEIAVTVR